MLMTKLLFFDAFRTCVIAPVRWRLMEPIHEAERWNLSIFVWRSRAQEPSAVRVIVHGASMLAGAASRDSTSRIAEVWAVSALWLEARASAVWAGSCGGFRFAS